MSMKVEENAEFRGQLRCLDLKPNSGFLAKEHVEVGAGIEASKLEHEHRVRYAQESGTTNVAEEYVIHVVRGLTGTLKSFSVGCVVAALLDATVTVDLHNNGVSVLTDPVEVDKDDDAYAIVEGAIDTAAVAHDDVLEVVVTVAAGGGTLGEGVFAALDLYEDTE